MSEPIAAVQALQGIDDNVEILAQPDYEVVSTANPPQVGMRVGSSSVDASTIGENLLRDYAKAIGFKDTFSCEGEKDRQNRYRRVKILCQHSGVSRKTGKHDDPAVSFRLLWFFCF